MPAPKQVRKQSEEIEELYKELNAGNDDTTDNVNIVPDTTDDAEPAEDSPAAEPTGEVHEDGGFEQKYRTLQGMYNSQVPRLEQENRTLVERVTGLEELLGTMQQAPATQPQTQPEPASAITQTELDEYGESIDIMRKVSREAVAPYQQKISELEAQLAAVSGQVVPRVEQLAQSQTQTAEQNFWSRLSTEVPNWREINDNPDFQTWLLEVDPLTGYSRQTFLEDAQQKYDSSRVAGFFNSWSLGNMDTTGEVQPNQTSTQQELAKQVAPGRARTSSPPAGGEPQNISTADIAKFYDDVRKGVYKGREEERGRMERDIFAAQRDGRVVVA